MTRIKITPYIFFVCAFALLCVCRWMYPDGYDTKKWITVEIILKETEASEKDVNRIFVVKTKEGGIASLDNIGATTFYTHKIGDKVNFRLSDKDIVPQIRKENAEGLAILLGFIALVTITISSIFIISNIIEYRRYRKLYF